MNFENVATSAGLTATTGALFSKAEVQGKCAWIEWEIERTGQGIRRWQGLGPSRLATMSNRPLTGSSF
jgi:hypothetical protein